MFKRGFLYVVIAGLVIWLGAGCSMFDSSVPAEDTLPVPGAIDDPNGMGKGLNGGPGSGFDGKGGSGNDWGSADALSGADKDGWVKADPSGNRLGMPIIYFAYDSDMLVPSEKAKLDAIYAYMGGKEKLALLIEGHCDQRGTDEYNRALGERRANAVRAYLQEKGLSDSRMKTISYGKERPAVEGSGESVWSQNRRGVPEPMLMP